MSKYCEKCGEIINENEERTNADGLVICELCFEDEKSLKSQEEMEEPDVFEDSELELLEDDLDDVMDDIDEEDDDYDEDEDDDYGYTSHRNTYNDDENDLYEGLVDQERSFY